MLRISLRGIKHFHSFKIFKSLYLGDLFFFKVRLLTQIKTQLKKGNTIGCFYVESPGMRMLLSKLKADDYTRLVAASSIIRPGVSKSGMMQEYIKRFRHPEKRKYTHPKLAKLMAETYGVMVYQEDVIKAFGIATGAILWEQGDLKLRKLTSPASIRNSIAVGDLEGYVHLLDAKNGKFLGRKKVSRKPIVELSSERNFLLAVDESGKLFKLSLN